MPCCLQSKLLLELERTHRRQRAKLVVKRRNSHSRDPSEFLHAQRFGKVGRSHAIARAVRWLRSPVVAMARRHSPCGVRRIRSSHPKSCSCENRKPIHLFNIRSLVGLSLRALTCFNLSIVQIQCPHTLPYGLNPRRGFVTSLRELNQRARVRCTSIYLLHSDPRGGVACTERCISRCIFEPRRKNHRTVERLGIVPKGLDRNFQVANDAAVLTDRFLAVPTEQGLFPVN